MRFLAALLCSSACWANWHDTSTGVELDKFAHPALTRVRGDGMSVAPGVLRGKGKSGAPWTVRLCDTCADEIWSGDLDGNGTLDYAIVGEGPFGNVRTDPHFSLTLLLMDSEGMPVPFFTPLFHGEKGEALKHLVKIDGKLRLLISRYDEIPSDARVGPYCSGHWVTQAYSLTNGVVDEVRGVFNGMRFPYVRNWAYSHPECANHPIGFSDKAKIVEIGTGAKGAVMTKLRAGSGGAGLAIEPVDDCASMFADAVVFDSAGGREVALPDLRGESQAVLVEKIRGAGVEVELRGMRECSVALLWGRAVK